MIRPLSWVATKRAHNNNFIVTSKRRRFYVILTLLLRHIFAGEGQQRPQSTHDDIIKWKHFPRNRPFVRGIHRSSVSSPHKGQWRGALMFSLIYARINGWVNNDEASDLRRYRAHYYVIVMSTSNSVGKRLNTYFTSVRKIEVIYINRS